MAQGRAAGGGQPDTRPRTPGTPAWPPPENGRGGRGVRRVPRSAEARGRCRTVPGSLRRGPGCLPPPTRPSWRAEEPEPAWRGPDGPGLLVATSRTGHTQQRRQKTPPSPERSELLAHARRRTAAAPAPLRVCRPATREAHSEEARDDGREAAPGWHGSGGRGPPRAACPSSGGRLSFRAWCRPALHALPEPRRACPPLTQPRVSCAATDTGTAGRPERNRAHARHRIAYPRCQEF